MSHRDFLPNTTMQNAFEDMGPRDDAKAVGNAEHWLDLIIKDSLNRDLNVAEYALALGHLKELLAVHIDAALADIVGRRETAKAIIEVGCG
jgi:hypothetical protein